MGVNQAWGRARSGHDNTWNLWEVSETWCVLSRNECSLSGTDELI